MTQLPLICEPPQETPADQNGKILDGVNALARHVGKSRRTVFRWLNAGLPILPGGRFDLASVERWMQQREGASESASGPGPAVQNGKSYWEAENKRFQTMLRQLEYERRRGNLIERDDAVKWVVSLVAEAKMAFLAMPRRLAPVLYGRQVRDIEEALRDEIYRILERLSRPTEKPRKSAHKAASEPSMLGLAEASTVRPDPPT